METNKDNPITGKEGCPIELEVASSWTKNYREKHPDETISQFFGKEILERILAQDGCLGIRFYYAICHEGKKHLIITGAMADGSDQLHGKAEEAATPGVEAAAPPVTYEVGEMSAPCPGSPGCPNNVLTGSNG